MNIRHPRKYGQMLYVLINKGHIIKEHKKAYCIELWSCNTDKQLLCRHEIYLGYYNESSMTFTLYPKRKISYAYYYDKQNDKQIVSYHWISDEYLKYSNGNYIELKENQRIEDYV